MPRRRLEMLIAEELADVLRKAGYSQAHAYRSNRGTCVNRAGYIVQRFAAGVAGLPGDRLRVWVLDDAIEVSRAGIGGWSVEVPLADPEAFEKVMETLRERGGLSQAPHPDEW